METNLSTNLMENNPEVNVESKVDSETSNSQNMRDLYDYDGFVKVSELKIHRNVFSSIKYDKVHARKQEFLTENKIRAIKINRDKLVTGEHMTLMAAIDLDLEYLPFQMNDKKTPDDVYITVGEAYTEKFKKGLYAYEHGKNIFNPEYKEIYYRQKKICYICKRFITIDKASKIGEYAEMIHLKPLRLGGEDTLDNKALVCHRCAELKGELLYSEPLRKVISNQRQLEVSLGLYNKE